MSVKEDTPWKSSQIFLEKRLTQLEEVIVTKLKTMANQKPSYANVAAKESGAENAATVNFRKAIVAKRNEQLQKERQRKEKRNPVTLAFMEQLEKYADEPNVENLLKYLSIGAVKATVVKRKQITAADGKIRKQR